MCARLLVSTASIPVHCRSSVLRKLWPNGTITATSMGGFSAPAGIVSLNSVNGTFVNGVNGSFAGGGYMVADAGNGVIKQVSWVLRGCVTLI